MKEGIVEKYLHVSRKDNQEVPTGIKEYLNETKKANQGGSTV